MSARRDVLTRPRLNGLPFHDQLERRLVRGELQAQSPITRLRMRGACPDGRPDPGAHPPQLMLVNTATIRGRDSVGANAAGETAAAGRSYAVLRNGISREADLLGGRLRRLASRVRAALSCAGPPTVAINDGARSRLSSPAIPREGHQRPAAPKGLSAQRCERLITDCCSGVKETARYQYEGGRRCGLASADHSNSSIPSMFGICRSQRRVIVKVLERTTGRVASSATSTLKPRCVSRR